jgi:hypothetical protein
MIAGEANEWLHEHAIKNWAALHRDLYAMSNDTMIFVTINFMNFIF